MPKTSRPRTLTKSALKKKLWQELRTFVKERDNNTCQLCGKKVSGSDAHTSHYLPKGLYSRYEFEDWNLKTLCMHCHLHCWHKNPIMVTLALKEKNPDHLRFLINKAQNYASNKPKPYSLEVLMAKYLHYLQKNSH